MQDTIWDRGYPNLFLHLDMGYSYLCEANKYAGMVLLDS